MEIKMNSSSAAGQRILSLLDNNSFVEIGAGVRARATDFQMDPADMPADGVITGYGVINDRLVYVYSQDSDVLGGSIGEMHAKKIIQVYDLAVRTGAPVIGLLDSSGLRVQEGTDGLDAFARLYGAMAKASGVIPQITAVFGRCAGGLAIAASLSDFTFMEENAQLFVNAPNTIAGNYEEKNNTASAASRAAAGCTDYVGTETDVLSKIRELVCILPSNFEDDIASECRDEMNRDCTGAAASVDDPALLAAEAADNGRFFELKSDHARDMVTGFARFGGTTAGVAGNRKTASGNVLTADGCAKAADFVRYCDAFGIPVITFSNVDGFARTIEDENRAGLAAARLTSVFAGSTVAKINVITGRLLGSAYAVMNAKGTGADITMAFPGSYIGIMDADLAARVIAPEAGQQELLRLKEEYESKQGSPDSAAARGLVDLVVDPLDLRRYLIGTLEILYTKRAQMPVRKHAAK